MCTGTYTPLDEAGSVPANTSDEASGARAGGGGRPPGTDFNYHDVTYGECVKHGNSASKPEWVKNHFALCHRGTVQVVGTDVRTGEPVGTLTYVETIIGYAFQGERSVAFDQYIENVQATGSVKESTTFLVNRWNESSGNGAILHKGEKHDGVTQGSGGYRGEVGSANEDPSIKSWKKDNMEVLIFDEDEASVTGKDKVHTYDFVPATLFISDGSHNVQLLEPKISVRFDSAPYLKFKKGSIFTNIRVTMAYDRSDPLIKETSQHIWDAQNHLHRRRDRGPHDSGPAAHKQRPTHIPGAVFADLDRGELPRSAQLADRWAPLTVEDTYLDGLRALLDGLLTR